MTWTQEQLDALTAAIAEGARTVKYGDREVTYRSMAEMLALQNRMQRDLGLSKGSTVRRYASPRKGLEQ